VGVMFTEITLENNLILSTILGRISDVLRGRLSSDQFSQIKFSFHLFPEEWDPNTPERQSNPTLYPDLHKRDGANRLGRALKRSMDVVGSLLLLATLSPVFLVIAAAIKLTSRGPHSLPPTAHRRTWHRFYLPQVSFHVCEQRCQQAQRVCSQLIAGEAAKHTNGAGEGIFKLTNDPRITPWETSCGARVSTNCRNSSTCCAAICRWSGRAHPYPTKSRLMPLGIAGACLKRSLESPVSGKWKDAAASGSTIWFASIFATLGTVLLARSQDSGANSQGSDCRQRCLLILFLFLRRPFNPFSPFPPTESCRETIPVASDSSDSVQAPYQVNSHA